MRLFSQQKRFYARRPKKPYVPPVLRKYRPEKAAPPDPGYLFAEDTVLEMPKGKLSKNEVKYEIETAKGNLTETLFKTFEAMEQETPLDVTFWKFGPQNAKKLGELQRIQKKTSQSLKNSTLQDSFIYQDARLFEQKIDYYENDFVATKSFYTQIAQKKYCDPFNVARYRALLHSLVKNVEQIRLIKEQVLPHVEKQQNSFEREGQLEKDILNFAQELAKRNNGDLEVPKEKEPVKEKETEFTQDDAIYDQLMRRAFTEIIIEKDFKGVELNQYAMAKILGKDHNKNEETIKSWILNLVKIFEKCEIILCHDTVLKEAKNIFGNQLSQEDEKIFDKLIKENDELLFKMRNPYEIKKPIYGLETRRFQDEPYENMNTRFSKNSKSVKSKK